MIEQPTDDKIKPGDHFGKWEVLAYAGKYRNRAASGSQSTQDRWECRCACGKQLAQLRGNILRFKVNADCRRCAAVWVGRQQRDPESRGRNKTAARHYTRVQAEGCVPWDWPAFLTWHRLQTSSGVPCRIDRDQPHSPTNTHLVRNPKLQEAIRVVAEHNGWTLETAQLWAAGVSRQAVGQRADAVRKKVGMTDDC